MCFFFFACLLEGLSPWYGLVSPLHPWAHPAGRALLPALGGYRPRGLHTGVVLRVGCVGVERVFVLFLDTVVNLEEAVIPVGVVGGGGRGGGLQGVPAEGVHGDLRGRQGVEALDAHGGGVPGV